MSILDKVVSDMQSHNELMSKWRSLDREVSKEQGILRSAAWKRLKSIELSGNAAAEDGIAWQLISEMTDFERRVIDGND